MEPWPLAEHWFSTDSLAFAGDYQIARFKCAELSQTARRRLALCDLPRRGRPLCGGAGASLPHALDSRHAQCGRQHNGKIRTRRVCELDRRIHQKNSPRTHTPRLSRATRSAVFHAAARRKRALARTGFRPIRTTRLAVPRLYPHSRSHFFNNGGTAFRNCSRCQSSRIRNLDALVPTGSRR